MNSLRRHSSLERAQGLAEYALLLVLVGVVVIVILTLFGSSTKSMYCQVATILDPDVEPEGCEGELQVSCVGPGDGAVITGPFSLEAVVTDNAGEDNVASVQFFVGGTFIKNEYVPRYCMGGGDGSCRNYDPSGLSSGSYVVKAIAHDADGNTGSCQFTINIP